MRAPCGLAFEDERAEGRAIVRVHILDPAALATSSQALMSFWPYSDMKAGYITLDRLVKVQYFIKFNIIAAFNKIYI